MSRPRNVFLISSPLQAIVADAILFNERGMARDDTIVFVEDARFLDFFHDIKCVAIENTRFEGRNRIASNLECIDRNLTDKVTLWVSDILWPMNNAVYTRLLNKNWLQAVNFFDEGIVLYWQEQLALLNHIREWVKFRLLSLKLDVRFTCPAKAPFYDNTMNGTVHALHPELLSNATLVQPLHLDLGRVGRMAQRIEDRRAGGGKRQTPLAEGCALLLSQPYYRVAKRDDFGLVVAGMAKHLRDNGHERLYVKLHPSEGVDLFNRYYRSLGFEIAFADMKEPIEVVLQSLPSSCTLASFNSSALLNARKFGFRGPILSYGLDWVAAQYPLQRKLFGLNASLLASVDAAIVLHRP